MIPSDHLSFYSIWMDPRVNGPPAQCSSLVGDLVIVTCLVIMSIQFGNMCVLTKYVVWYPISLA